MLTVEKSVSQQLREAGAALPTPCYVIDEARLLTNMKKIETLRTLSGVKSVLALKCFSTWGVFNVMRPYMDGTTSSSSYEARLGQETFGKETHAYSVAFSDEEIEELRPLATKFIFNSFSQWQRYASRVAPLPVGIRINPGISYSHFDLADPARTHSRLGVSDFSEIERALPTLSGAMFHCQCENDDFPAFVKILDHIAHRYGPVLEKLQWVSLGGGIYFTKEGYPLEAFAQKLADFSKTFGVQVYLEPGEAAITQSGFFVTRVLDVMNRGVDIAVVDGAVETHLLDVLIYQGHAKMEDEPSDGLSVQVAGKTCLAGDVFGTFRFTQKPKVGDRLVFSDTAGYTSVKKNWFNGIQLPALVIRRLDGRLDVMKTFGYDDFKNQLS